MLHFKLTIISTAYPAYLIGWRFKEAGTCQVQVTDGRDGDSVVGVVVLHRLRRADYRVPQIIFVLLCSCGSSDKSSKRNVQMLQQQPSCVHLTERFLSLLQHLHIFLMPLEGK